MNTQRKKNNLSTHKRSYHLLKEYQPQPDENATRPVARFFMDKSQPIHAYCSKLCSRRFKETFKRFFDTSQQKDIQIAYSFARVLDDLVDGTTNRSIQQKAIRQANTLLDIAYSGRFISQTNSFAFQLQKVAQKYHIPKKLFKDIIDGVEMDVLSDNQPMSQKQLDRYIEKVSIVPGKIYTYLFQHANECPEQLIHHLFTAGQYADILSDISKDAKAGKIYLPKEILEKHNIFNATAENICDFKQLSFVVHELAEKTLKHTDEALMLLKNTSLKNSAFYEELALANKSLIQRTLTQYKAPKGIYHIGEKTSKDVYKLSSLLENQHSA